MRVIPAAKPLPLRLLALVLLSPAAAFAVDIVRLTELPPPAEGVAGVSNVAADGTVVGTAHPVGHVLRWRPGQPAEDLGGDTFTLENIMPLISADGSVIVAGNYFPPPNPDDPNSLPVSKPGIWRGGSTWEPINDTVLEASTPFGIADNGLHLAGSGYVTTNPPNGEPVYEQAWKWSAAAGQAVLPGVPGLRNTQAWAVSNDGATAAGFGHDGPDDYTRYALIWTAAGVRQLFDADSRPVGQAIACNSDCSVVVGAGDTAGNGSPQAWRWTAQGGVQFLGTAPGAQEDAVYYAFDLSEDGSTIVGSYPELDPEQGYMNRGFLWTAQGGMTNIVDYLADHGIAYGDGFNDLVVNAMSRDGRFLLMNGSDADYQRHRALVRIDGDAIFANGFE